MGVVGGAALVLIGGWLGGRLLAALRLPPLLGFMLVGILVGPSALDLLDERLLEAAPDISSVALVIVVTSSVFAIDVAVLRRSALTIGLVGTVPGVLEGLTVLALSTVVLDLTWVQGGILGFTVAIVSPAVVVPAMIRLKDAGWGAARGIPVISLAATNLDGAMAIILWLVFMTVELGGSDIATVAAESVLQIVLGTVWGGAWGLATAWLFDRVLAARAGWLRAGAFAAVAVGLFVSALALPMNAPVALLIGGLVLVNRSAADFTDADRLFTAAWKVGSILLFGVIGALADLDLIADVGVTGLLVVLGGVAARVVGAVLALTAARSELTASEKTFVGISTLGKATVQATLAPFVLAYGVANGETIVAVAILSILVMAPLASIAIELSYHRLLSQDGPTSS